MAEPFHPKFADLVRSYSSTTGTGKLVLGEAAPGFTGFGEALQPGDSFYYAATSLDKAGESEVGRGTLNADGSIARDPIDGTLTNFSKGIKSVALVTAAEWFERAASVDMVDSALEFDAGLPGSVARPLQAKAGDVLCIDDFGPAGDGVADDGVKVEAAFSASAGKSLSASAGRSFRLGTWSGHSAGGALNLDLGTARFEAAPTQTIFSGGQDFDVRGGTFDTFLNVASNSTTAGAPADLRFSGVRFSNGENIALNFENPFDRFAVVSSRFDNCRGIMLRGGRNDPALQPGWRGFSAIGNHIKNVRPVASGNSGSNGVSLTYAPGAIVALNQVEGIETGRDAEGFAFYSKSIHGLVVANSVSGAIFPPGGTGRFYCINLKGGCRGETSVPLGYGAMALGNQLMSGDGSGAGAQMQSDEQAIIANNFDSFAKGIEFDTKISGSIIGLNRLYGPGATSSFAMAGSGAGEAVVSIGNVSRNFVNGISYACAAGATLDRLSLIGQHVQGIGSGSGGVALQVVATDPGSISNLLIANSTFRGFTAGVNLTRVHGATLSNLAFGDITNMVPGQRAFQFTSCKRIVGRNAQQAAVQTTSASAVALAEVQLSNENVICLRVRMCSRKTDGSAREVIEARCAAYMEAGAVTLGAPTVTKQFATAINISFATVSGVRIRASVTGIAGQAWDHFASADFEIL